MQWLEVTIKTVSPAIDLLGAKLTAIGYDSFIIDDAEDFQSFLEENTQYWDYVDESLAQQMENISQIRLYIEDDQHAPERISSLKSELSAFRAQNPDVDLGSLEVTLENLQEEDWETSWKKYYQPIPIGERLLIVPQWMDPENPENRIPVRLDPGMIFGTGAHASTQMCLRALERAVTGGERVIDLGSGSGILSIAALLLGAKTATGVDIDPKAEDIARENAALNQLTAPRFQAVTGNVIGDRAMMEKLSEGGYDIVLANIVADVIIPLSAVVPHFLRPQGLFICSGVLNTRLAEVQEALEQAGLQVVDTEMQEDWCRLSARLK
jgi:ribosomal protein L11 methyltransferase